MDKNKTTYKMAFGKRLKEARESRELTQAEVAKRGGFTQAVIARLERGGIDNPGKNTLEKIYSKDVLDLSCDEIYNLTRDIAYEEEVVEHITTEDEIKRRKSEHPKWLSWDIKMSIPEQWFLKKRTSKEILDYLLDRLNEEELNKVAALAYALYNSPTGNFKKGLNDPIMIKKTNNSNVDYSYKDLAVLVYFKDEIYEIDDEEIIDKADKLLINTLGKYIEEYCISSYNYEKSVITGILPDSASPEVNDKFGEILSELSKQQDSIMIRSLKESVNNKLKRDNLEYLFNVEDIKLICSREEFSDYSDNEFDYSLGVLDTSWLYRFNSYKNFNDDAYFHYALVKYKVKYDDDRKYLKTI